MLKLRMKTNWKIKIKISECDRMYFIDNINCMRVATKSRFNE